MFEKLGYELCVGCNLLYKRQVNYNTEYIHFIKKDNNVYIKALTEFKHNDLSFKSFNLQELQAINKQIEELEWNINE